MLRAFEILSNLSPMRISLLSISLSCLLLNLSAQNPSQSPHKHAPTQQLAANPVKFIPNHNQWIPAVLYRAQIPGGSLLLKKNAFQYVFKEVTGKAKSGHPHASPEKTTLHSFEVNFLGADLQNTAKVQGLQASGEKWNFYLGNDPSRWAKEVPVYQSVYYHEIYQGIDMKLYQNQSSLKYEFILDPGANPDLIRMQYQGATEIKLEDQDLHVQIGNFEVIEKQPYCYQKIGGKTVSVPAQFVLKDNRVHFAFPEGYDQRYELIIDPELVFSTYSGFPFDNWGFTATFDAAGNLYSGGIIFSADQTGDFPVTIGDSTFIGSGGNDLMILKFNSDGTNLEYATLIGGNVVEFPHSLVVNASNELVIFGTTGSNNFPTTEGAFNRQFAGGSSQTVSANIFSNGSDLFLTKLDANGALLASTYIGGTANDGLNIELRRNYADEARGDVVSDSSDFIYVATSTQSSDFPIRGAFSSPTSTGQDGVVLKVNPDLSDLVWSTALASSGSDAAFSLKINEKGEIYVCGATNGSDFDTHPEALIPNRLGSTDGFIAKLTAEGAWERATYLGTTALDHVFLLDIDPDHNIYALGLTSGNYPVSPGVYSDPGSRQFIQKLDSNLNTSLLSTVVGSGRPSPDISPTAFLVNSCGNIYLAGWGGAAGEGATDAINTQDLPTTSDAFSRITDGSDFYIAIYERDFNSFLYGTFLGGSISADHVDGGTSRFNKDGVIYHAVCASCGNPTNDFPTTPGAWSSQDGGDNCNNAVFKFDIGSLEVDFNILDGITSQAISNACEFPVNVNFQYQGTGATTWDWRINGQEAGNTRDINWTFDSTGVYNVELTVGNPVSCLQEVSTSKLFPVSSIQVADISLDTTICFSESATLRANVIASNDFNATWSPTLGLDDPNSLTPTANPEQSTTYVLTVEDDNGCMAIDSVQVNVIEPLRDNFDILNFSNVSIDRECVPAQITLAYDVSNAGTPDWIWEVEGFGTFSNQDTVRLTFTETGTYTIQLEATRPGECPQTVGPIVRELTVLDVAVETVEDMVICQGESVALPTTASSSDLTYSWLPTEGLDDPTSPNPVATPNETTLYVVRATNADGCVDEASVNVEVIPEIILDFELTMGSDCAKPSTLTFTNNSLGSDNFEWRISDGAIFTEATPAPYEFFEGGTFEVTLTARNGDCEATETRLIEVENNLLPPPNIITPNGDSRNEVFDIRERVNYKLEIFNRWGNRVFEADPYQNDWGKGVDSGVYFYLLTSPAGIECRGWIEVVR